MKHSFIHLVFLVLNVSLLIPESCKYGWANCADGTQVQWPCVFRWFSNIPLGCQAQGFANSEEAAAKLCMDHGGVRPGRTVFGFQRCGRIS